MRPRWACSHRPLMSTLNVAAEHAAELRGPGAGYSCTPPGRGGARIPTIRSIDPTPGGRRSRPVQENKTSLQPPSGLSSSTREMLIMASRGSWKMSRVPLESSPRAVSKSQGPVRSLRGSRKAMFRKAVKTSEKHKESTQRAERSFIPPSLALHSLRFPLAPKLHAHHEAGRGCRHSVRHRSASAGHHPRLGRTILCHRDGGTLWIIGRTAGSNPACVHAPRGLLHVLHHYNHPQVRNSSAISLAIASCTHDSGLALLTSPMA